MSGLEAWCMHGGAVAEWRTAVEAGTTERDLVALAVRAGPPELPQQLVRDLSGWAHSSRRVGVCEDREEENIRARMLEWVQAWKVDPEHPSRALPPARIKGRWRPEDLFGPAPTTSRLPAGAVPVLSMPY